MNPFVKKITIGSFAAKNNLMLAPMAGITDTPFRIHCLNNGAGIVCAEMVSAKAVEYDNKKSVKMLAVDKKEHPVSMQIFGGDAESISIAAKAAEAAGADIIDINAGCPVKKINRAGAGCVLIKDEKLLASIVNAAVNSVKVPVTLKTRIGLASGDFKGDRIAKLAENEGAAAVIMHARYANNVHGGPADLEALAKVVASVKIPVIGNGGIVDVNTAGKMFETGVLGIMVGRGAIGNINIFKSIINGCDIELNPKENVKIFFNLIKENVNFYGEKNGIARSRKTVGFWIKGFPMAGEIRGEFVKLNTLAAIQKLFGEYL